VANEKQKAITKKVFKEAGITINGSKPWDIKVNNDQFYPEVFSRGSLGFGESYMDGDWSAKKLDETVTRMLRAKLENKIISGKLMVEVLKAKLFNLQSAGRAFQVGEEHYDAGNDLYKITLDKRLVYTCGYWKNAKTLDKAQEDKLDLVCKKVGLKKGDKILDIGCGWGSFLKFAAEKYGVEGVGITVSKEQVKLGRENCKGLPIEIRLQDYRDLNEKFDHIISLGMFEHVGPKNYREYMKIAHKCLKNDGLFLLHTIGGHTSVDTTDPWLEKYIFANAVLPSVKQVSTAIEDLFVMEDWHNFSADYDKTLMAWHAKFKKNWPKLKGRYSERFYRMWEFYLLFCAATFRSRKNQLWQIILSKNGVEGGYQSIR
jgi:cyclopropane-fatty-acyl-phospholipid synthase